MNGDGYSAATLDGRGRRYVHQHRESHSGLAPQTGTSGQVPWEYASHHSQHGHHHHQHHSGGRHSVPAPEPTSDVTSSYVRTLPHAHHHRSQGQLASEAYHVQHTPSRLQRLDGGLSLHQSATGPYGGVTPSYADPYGARLSQSSSSSSQNKQHGGQMTRSSTAADPYQWYKSGTLGRNSSRPTLRDIPIDTSAFVSQDAHPTAVVYPYRGQGATHQQAALAAAAAAAARYRSGAAAGYPMGYFAAEAPTQAHIATTPRRVSSDVYPRSPRHLGGRGNEQGLLSVAVPGTRAEQAALSQSLLRSVSSDKGPLSVHDIAAVAAQGEKQKIAVVKPIKQQASNNSHGGSGSDGRRNIDFHHGLGVGSGGTPHRTAASAPAQTQTSPWHQVAPQPSLASLGRELLTTTAGHHGPITSPRVMISQ
ncbi:unnamed protein product [Notodromas monacha]|uniref:Uncharacterized protein n=1 Tax=Notodromas monacha TaxID=399045 RepID=A0A7R9BNP2_9CRUS|nr:unnamed protein product [Notodromas monacha]CAG0918870.1 unnamed protein product [Notodromas monacha]